MRSAMTVAMAVGLAISILTPIAAAGQPIETAHVPVIVNIYPNSGTNEPEARDAIREANIILRQANITLRVVGVNSIAAGSGGDNGDGDFTAGERRSIQTFGGQELGKLPNARGLKIAFGRIPKVGSTTPGTSLHRNSTIIVKERATAADTGSTIAHEFGHVLTLVGQYRIDATTTANDAGHAPDMPGPTGNGNLMAPSTRRTGTHLTKDQIDRMTQPVRGLFNKEPIANHSKCATQFSRLFPAVKCATQFGGTTDSRGDQSSGRSSAPSQIFDLDQVFLNSLHPTDQSGGDINNIDARITVSGLLPTREEIDAMYALGFDIDANSETGVTYAGLAGIDRIVYIIAAGDIDLGTFDLNGVVLDLISNTLTPLPEKPIFETEHEVSDLDEPAVPVATSFLFRIPKNLLNLSETDIPVVAAAGLIGAISDPIDDVIYDVTNDLFFDSLSFLRDPTLTTFGNGVPTPGQPYMFSIEGLTPNDIFNLFLNDQVVFTGVLDGTGSFTGSFIFPSDLSITDFHFLTAQDSTGEFGYSITCPEAEVHLPINLRDHPDPVKVGRNLTYTIRVANTGSAMATGVKVTDTLPRGVNLISAPSDCSIQGRTITCTIPSLVPDERVTLQIIVKPTVPGEFRNRVTVTANENPRPSGDATRTTVIR